MNKKILFLILLVVLAFTIPLISEAKDLAGIIGSLSTNLLGLGLALSTIAFMVAGITWLAAGANPGMMSVAKGSLVAAVVGIVIMLLAKSAGQFVSQLFGGL